MFCHKSCERHCQIETHGYVSIAMIKEAIYLLVCFSASFSKQDVSILEDGSVCLLYTSDAADDLLCVDLGGRLIIKKKKLCYQLYWS